MAISTVRYESVMSSASHCRGKATSTFDDTQRQYSRFVAHKPVRLRSVTKDIFASCSLFDGHTSLFFGNILEKVGDIASRVVPSYFDPSVLATADFMSDLENPADPSIIGIQIHRADNNAR